MENLLKSANCQIRPSAIQKALVVQMGADFVVRATNHQILLGGGGVKGGGGSVGGSVGGGRRWSDAAGRVAVGGVQHLRGWVKGKGNFSYFSYFSC